MKRIISCVLILVLSTVLTACGSGEPDTSVEESPGASTEAEETSGASDEETSGSKKIGLSVCHMADEWAIGSYTLIQDKLKERGYEVTFANCDWETKTEAQNLDTFKSMGLDLLVTQPVDEDASRDMVEDFIATSDIPVITAAVAPDYEGIKGFVGWDTWDAGYAVGQNCAQYIQEELGGKANVVILGFYNENCLTRQRGFEQALEEADIEFEIKFDQNFEGSRETAVNIMENIIQADSDFDVVWAAFDGGALGARTALEAVDHKAKVWSSGGYEQEIYDLFDADDKWFHATYLVAPEVYGGAVVDAVDRFFAGETDLGEVYAPCKVATVENFKDIW